MAPGTALQIRQCVSGLVLLLLIIFPLGSWSLLAELVMSPIPAACLLASSFFTALSFLHWYRANHILGVAAGMSLNITYVFWGTVLSAMLFRQTPGLWRIVGMAFVMAGVVFIALGQRERKPGGGV
jgi:drug/metabolite transporter (DMT)-like permease